MSTLPIIRTSDRNTFRECRQLWDFKSPIRGGWVYQPGIEPLDFGTGYHQGLDVYYDPRRWNDPTRAIVEYESEAAFLQYLEGWKKRLMDTGHWESQEGRWKELVELGLGMLQHYFLWAPDHDKGWKPVKSEIEFEVPIPVPVELREVVGLSDRFRAWHGQLQVWTGDNYVDVHYQGRIDLVIQFLESGRYGLVDHKTAAQFGQTEHLEMDTQTRSYAWALNKMLGLDIRSIIYSEHRKAVPHPPKLLKKGLLSMNKSQATTVEMYLQRIKELGHDPKWYADFLPRLAANQAEYFRRIEVSYSPAELEQTEINICLEAIDMLNDPFIYPNPGRWRCNGCAFRTPCLMKQEGNDFTWHLENSGLYIQKKPKPPVEVGN